MIDGLIIDLFAGAGGASAGIEAAVGRPVDLAVNHDPVALAVHKANHPETHHERQDIWRVDPAEATKGRKVAVLWASPDCTHFSVAKGGKPRQKKIRSLAWAVVRWAKATKPKVIFLENVTEFKGWGPLTREGKPDKRFLGKTFRAWKAALERLGYVVDERTLDASRAIGKRGKWSKSEAVRLIGNSVCPEVAEAIVRENVVIPAERRVA